MKQVVKESCAKIIQLLNEKPQYKECLFSRGYFITEDNGVDANAYPFYGQWKDVKIKKYTVFVHKDQDFSVLDHNDVTFLIIGHAYNPFNECYQERDLLLHAAEGYKHSREQLFACVNEWTGIFCLFVLLFVCLIVCFAHFVFCLLKCYLFKKHLASFCCLLFNFFMRSHLLRHCKLKVYICQYVQHLNKQ